MRVRVNDGQCLMERHRETLAHTRCHVAHPYIHSPARHAFFFSSFAFEHNTDNTGPNGTENTQMHTKLKTIASRTCCVCI